MHKSPPTLPFQPTFLLPFHSQPPGRPPGSPFSPSIPRSRTFSSSHECPPLFPGLHCGVRDPSIRLARDRTFSGRDILRQFLFTRTLANIWRYKDCKGLLGSCETNSDCCSTALTLGCVAGLCVGLLFYPLRHHGF